MIINYNKVIVCGVLCDVPDRRVFANNNVSMATFNIAINEKLGHKNTVTFAIVKCFGKTADNVYKYLTKGSNIMIEGKLRLEQWKDDRTNQNRSKLYILADNVTFLSEKSNNSNNNTNNNTEDNPPVSFDDDPII